MPLPLLVLAILLISSLLHNPAERCHAATDTISPGQALAGSDKIVSSNGRYALGFFQTGSKSDNSTTLHWYLGIWFNNVPKLTTVWVANGDSPVGDPTSCELTISRDGNLVILKRRTRSTVWSTQANLTSNATVATLSDGGNLALRSSSNTSDILWQSFDHPTSTLFPGAKLGRDKATGLNRRIVSRKNSIDQAPGVYSLEIDPTGASQLILVELNSGVAYWSSGEWNGQYFNNVPEMRGTPEFVNNEQEEYFAYGVHNETIVMHLSLELSGQMKAFVWVEARQDWLITYSQPRSQCDAYAICGPFAICDDNALPFCNCMKGFSIRSVEDWELEDRTGGCVRNTPLDCAGSRSTSSTDKFYSVPCFKLPRNAQNIDVATSEGECAQACLSNCSCTAYSYGDNGCYVWHDGLLNVIQHHYDDPSNIGVKLLKLRLAARELRNRGNSRRGMVIGAVTGATLGLLGLVLLLMIWRNRKKRSRRVLNSVQGGNGIVAFRYSDLQRATKNFSEKLGTGGFGSVFKGFLADSTAIAVKMLEGVRQGEKRFRAEVSSIGIIQHVNLVRLIGFCCEGNRRMLVYDYMPNHSLDVHLFQRNGTLLNWTTRYRIALGIARGLAYLHQSCQDCIIHCDIKPQNILLDASFTPKIADFGMAKLLKRDFSRALTTIRGTIGYLAPEWISGVAITTKADVYSYGMVMLEIISGRSNLSEESTNHDSDVYFPLQAAHNLLKGEVQSLVDHKLYGDVNLEEVERACKVACWCIQDEDFDRPTMGEVVQILEGLREVDMPPLPMLLQAVAGISPSTCM